MIYLDDEYFAFCESLWKQWNNSELYVSKYTSEIFQMDYMPEPYLSFGKCNNPLFFFTTNPGRGIPIQNIDSVRVGSSPVNSKNSYKEVARVMGEYYVYNLKGTAKRRIQSILNLAYSAGYDGVVQVEACPFHSPILPNKSKFLEKSKGDKTLKRYQVELKNLLVDKPVVAVSAVGSKREIGIDSIKSSSWLTWQSEIMGLNADHMRIIPLTIKEGKVTSIYLGSDNEVNKSGLILMMGGNHLPKPDSLEMIAPMLRQSNI